MDLTDNAVQVLQARYLQRDEDGHITESPEQLFARVARSIAAAESAFGGLAAVSHWEERFGELLCNLDFLPNSPTLMNAGTGSGQLSACFVLPIEDSMVGIFDSLKLAALIQQTGGGTGFSFSRLRPRGDFVTAGGGTSSGPVSFMKIFDAATEHIRLGGKRRGANMGILRVDHPDIREFIESKRDGHSLQNFNLSVAATDEFMQAVQDDEPLTLRHPRDGKPREEISASELFETMSQLAWKTGDPGMVFIDTITRANPTPALGPIEATNPCGEVPLLPYEACNLGSINLRHMLQSTGNGGTGAEVDWDRLAETTHTAVRFLDNVICVGRWPAPEIERMVEGNRKIGLGVMGFAEMLIELGIPYASPKAVEIADQLMQFISAHARDASEQLADERGVFDNWADSTHVRLGRRLRNATLTSIAPTGTIGIIAGTSPGIEPLFALAYRREHVLDEQTLIELNPLVVRFAKQHGISTDQLLAEVQSSGSLAGSDLISQVDRELFRTALEIEPSFHLQIQSAFQKHVDNAVSKTINLPESATVQQVSDVFTQAWQLGLKGVTIYRYGSKDQQVLYLGVDQQPYEQEHFARCDPQACKL